MHRLAQILGALFLAAGFILAVIVGIQPGSMLVIGLTHDVAVLLMVGGGICLSLYSLIETLQGHFSLSQNYVPNAEDFHAKSDGHAVEDFAQAQSRSANSSKLNTIAAEAEALRGTIAPRAKVRPEVRPSVADTLDALEQAKADISAALSFEQRSPERAVADVERPMGGAERVSPSQERPPMGGLDRSLGAGRGRAEERVTTTERAVSGDRLVERKSTLAALVEQSGQEAPRVEKILRQETVVVAQPQPSVVEAPAAVEDEYDDPDLYVVEEKVIRGRPARILSDGTVEAETEEGWMRFENLEHLDEYIDAMNG